MQKQQLNPKAKLDFTFIKVAEHEQALKELDALLQEMFIILTRLSEKDLIKESFQAAGDNMVGEKDSVSSSSIIMEAR